MDAKTYYSKTQVDNLISKTKETLKKGIDELYVYNSTEKPYETPSVANQSLVLNTVKSELK